MRSYNFLCFGRSSFSFCLGVIKCLGTPEYIPIHDKRHTHTHTTINLFVLYKVWEKYRAGFVSGVQQYAHAVWMWLEDVRQSFPFTSRTFLYACVSWWIGNSLSPPLSLSVCIFVSLNRVQSIPVTLFGSLKPKSYVRYILISESNWTELSTHWTRISFSHLIRFISGFVFVFVIKENRSTVASINCIKIYRPIGSRSKWLREWWNVTRTLNKKAQIHPDVGL